MRSFPFVLFALLCPVHVAQSSHSIGADALDQEPLVDSDLIRAEQRIFSPNPHAGEGFGVSMAPLGDLNGDGIGDLAVGATPTGVSNGVGRVYVLFMDGFGAIQSARVIGFNEMNFGPFEADQSFGIDVANIGDRDGDGVPELAVGCPQGEAGSRGAVWILFLNADGTLKARHKISEQSGGFPYPLTPFNLFGRSVADIGDIDGDGFSDLAVGHPFDDDGGTADGAVWILFMDSGTRVKSARKLSKTTPGGFGDESFNGGYIGYHLDSIGDLDGDGLRELAVAMPLFGVKGAIWIAFLDPDGAIRRKVRISESENVPSRIPLSSSDGFGYSVADLGDLDGDGIGDLAIGAPYDNHAGPSWSCRGAFWAFFLREDGTVREFFKVAQGVGGFRGPLGNREKFGLRFENLGDRNGDGIPELGTTSFGGDASGGMWILSLDGIATEDFEQRRDSVTPAENGRAIRPTDSRFHSISVEGQPNVGPTAAVFDSTPTGPNALSSDPDLLVDLGNVLILQENGMLSSPDVYALPDDDGAGGVFTLSLQEEGVTPLSMDLIDICPSGTQAAFVRLIDTAQRTRTYLVPSGWTEDVAVHGGAGYRTLDLTTLALQPGFEADASAVEGDGFAPHAVCSIEVELLGSGAIDNLRYDPHPAPESGHALTTFRDQAGAGD